MSEAPSSPDPAAAGTIYFDLWSWMDPVTQDPPGVISPDIDTCSWTDTLCASEPPPNGTKAGSASFTGTRLDANHFECTGTITVDPDQAWSGTVTLKGKLALKNGQLGEGPLTVQPSPASVPFRVVRVTRKNPKRYIAQG